MPRPLRTIDVAHRPFPGTSAPTSVGFSPDGRYLSFLAAGHDDLRQRLVLVDTTDGTEITLPTPGTEVEEADLTLEERLRRERARELAVGVTRYAWAASASVLLVPMADGLWVFDDPMAEPTRVVAADDLDQPILDPRISADGRHLLFVSGDEVHVLDRHDERGPITVTSGAAGTGRTNGLAEYIAQEEMARPHGCWLSPDARRVAFCEVDETHIPVYRIMHQGSDQVGPDAQEDHRYPFAGEANAVVRLGIVAGDGSTRDEPLWLDLGCTGIGEDRYLARVTWVTATTLVAQVTSRDQCRLDVIRFDVTDGTGTLLWRETSDVWINLHDILAPRPDDTFLWASERTGFQHLELRDADGSLHTTLTEGPWVVTAVHAVDETHVWFTATEASPRERHLYRVALDGDTDPERVTTAPGVHTCAVNAESGQWVDLHSDPATPPTLRLHGPARPDGLVVADAGTDPRLTELGLLPPEPLTITAEDGTVLHGSLFRPAGDGPFPTVIWTYGGPHAQLVVDAWSATTVMRPQYLRQLGFAVAVVDGRGSANRGVSFEGALRHRMGTVEVDDQVALVDHLVALGVTDPDHVAIYGWSYGGYLSAMCLARRPDVFAAACAGAPVTSWDGYDTHYTERYMGTPQDNPDGYREGSVMTHVEGLRDRALLLVHGLIDENVHFRHTARLVQELHRAGIDHRLLLYPDERHVPRDEADRASMEDQIARFFQQVLTADLCDQTH